MLSDQATVIAVYLSDKKTIVRECISGRAVRGTAYSASEDPVHTLSVSEKNNLFMSGSGSRQVVQYDLETARVVKIYELAGLGGLLSSARCGGLWIYGGNQSPKFVVID